MALSDPRIIFGVHSFTPYDRATFEPFGTAKVLGSSTFSLSGELVKLNGGSNRYPFAIEDSTITAEIALAMKEFPDFAFELFLGKAPTENSAESGGSTTTLTNRKGTSVVATTGIAAVGVESGEEANLKFGKYLVKVVSATTVDVFGYSDVDFARGTDLVFEDDNLKVTASALTIVTSTAVTVPNLGVELTGDSGTIALVTGDTASFEIRPINTKSMDVVIGATTDVFPEFGAIMMGQQRGNGEMIEIEVFRAKATGLPMGLEEKAFAEPEVTAEAFFDSTANAVAKFRHVTP